MIVIDRKSFQSPSLALHRPESDKCCFNLSFFFLILLFSVLISQLHNFFLQLSDKFLNLLAFGAVLWLLETQFDTFLYQLLDLKNEFIPVHSRGAEMDWDDLFYFFLVFNAQPFEYGWGLLDDATEVHVKNCSESDCPSIHTSRGKFLD